MANAGPRYRQLEQIGSGTYGDVFRAIDTRTGAMVAIKRVRSAGADNGFSSTSLREVALLNALHHPNLVHLHETVLVMPDVDIASSPTAAPGRGDESGGAAGERSEPHLVLVLEYLDTDLKRALDAREARNERWAMPTIKSLLWQLLSGVEYLHSERVLHRDLKPQNLLLGADGELKVADLGLARFVGLPVRALEKCVVTIWYRAPELLLGAPLYGFAIDMWAVGCIFAEMVTGRALFAGAPATAASSDADPAAEMAGLRKQMREVACTLGAPRPADWPELTSLPRYAAADWLPSADERRGRALAELVPIDPLGLDLLARMLTYNPAQRISAHAALAHPFLRGSRPTSVPPLASPASVPPTWLPRPGAVSGPAERAALDPPRVADAMMDARAPIDS